MGECCVPGRVREVKLMKRKFSKCFLLSLIFSFVFARDLIAQCPAGYSYHVSQQDIAKHQNALCFGEGNSSAACQNAVFACDSEYLSCVAKHDMVQSSSAYCFKQDSVFIDCDLPTGAKWPSKQLSNQTSVLTQCLKPVLIDESHVDAFADKICTVQPSSPDSSQACAPSLTVCHEIAKNMIHEGLLMKCDHPKMSEYPFYCEQATHDQIRDAMWQKSPFLTGAVKASCLGNPGSLPPPVISVKPTFVPPTSANVQ